MNWQKVEGPPAVDVPGLDVYAAWNLSEARRHIYGDAASGDVPVLIELADVRLKDFAELSQDVLFIPPMLLNPPPDLAPLFEAPRFVPAVARPSFFDSLRSGDRPRLQATIRSVTLSRAVSGQQYENKWPGQAAPLKNGRRSGRVVVGVIDHGIAFANRRFRHRDGSTRFDSIWLQGVVSPGRAPPLFGRGREILANEIDEALTRCTHAGAVDEDEVYQEALGVADFSSAAHKPLFWRRGHGTHVLDVAAGAEPGAEPAWPIVAVELPTFVTADSSGASLTKWAIEGLYYILLRSLEIASRDGTEPMPVVVNLSYGFTAGPHDGTHPIERAFENIIEMWQQVVGARVRLVLPAGNHRQARLHAKVDFGSGAVVDLPWRIQPADSTPNHVEIWLPPGVAVGGVSVSLVPPEGTAPSSEEVSGPAGCVLKLRDGDADLAQIACQDRAGPGPRGLYLVTVAPTAVSRETATSKPAPSGLWTIRIRKLALPGDSTVHAWIQRDDSIPGFGASGRQSYFDHPGYQRFDDGEGPVTRGQSAASPVSRLATLNAIGTSNNPCVVVAGGYVLATARATTYSGSGPTSGPRSGPDVLAVSDESPVVGGRRATGTRSGSAVSMNGTSVAAPVVTRLIARVLQSGGTADATFVRDYARAYTAQLGGVPNDPNLYGAGLLPPDP